MVAQVVFCGALIFAAGPAQGPQHVVVVLDNSGSMNERLRSDPQTTKIQAARTALLQVLDHLEPTARIGVVVLNGGRSTSDNWIIPLGPLDRRELRATIQQIRAGGRTPLGRYMKVGTDALLAARAEAHYGTYKLLIVTDGEASDEQYVESYLPDILSRGVSVDVIGVDMVADHSLATRVHTYRRADDAESLKQAISEVILAESLDDAGHSAGSDFELLAGLSPEVATAILQALAQPGNHPIGEGPPGTALAVNTNPNTASTPPPSPRQTIQRPPNAEPPGNRRGRGFVVPLVGILCLGGVTLVVLLGVGVILVVKK